MARTACVSALKTTGSVIRKPVSTGTRGLESHTSASTMNDVTGVARTAESSGDKSRSHARKRTQSTASSTAAAMPSAYAASVRRSVAASD